MDVRRVVAVLALLAVAGCASHPVATTRERPALPAAAQTSGSTSGSASHPARPARPTLRQIVASPGATLNIVRVTPGPAGLSVRAWWVLRWHHRTLGAIVASHDGMRTASYVRGTDRAWERRSPRPSKPRPVPGMGRLMPTDVFSLQDGTRAQQGGGDGATLDPFDRMARSVGGSSWEIFDVPETAGERAYTSGQVVLPDGRLLVLLNNWSGDRRGRPSSRWHGLWISDGADWATYQPWHPRFVPALPKAEGPWGPLQAIDAAVDPQQTRPGIIWLTTLTGLYVSEDGARTFHEIPARPGT